MYRIVQEFKEVVSIYYPGKFSLFDYFVLQHIYSCNNEGCTQYQLAKGMHVSPARINPVIKKLVNDNMVSVKVDESSLRVKKIITVTEIGRETVDNIDNKSRKIIDNADEESHPNYEDFCAFTGFLTNLYAKIPG
jgi:DNA-binding MarR family transcriptional regulator